VIFGNKPQKAAIGKGREREGGAGQVAKTPRPSSKRKVEGQKPQGVFAQGFR